MDALDSSQNISDGPVTDNIFGTVTPTVIPK